MKNTIITTYDKELEEYNLHGDGNPDKAFYDFLANEDFLNFCKLHKIDLNKAYEADEADRIFRLYELHSLED